MARKKKVQVVFEPPSADEVVHRLKQWVNKHRRKTPFAKIALELGLPEKRFRKAMQGKDELRGFRWEILDRLAAADQGIAYEAAAGEPDTDGESRKKELSPAERDRINNIQHHTIEQIIEPVFCCIVGQEISAIRCLGIQGQPECFGCSAPSRFCEECSVRPVAFPEVEMCGSCLAKALESEKDMGIPSFAKEMKVECPLAGNRAIGIATCRSMQGPECGTCDAPSRICEQCKERQVRYPDYGLCLHCTVAEYGNGWTPEDHNEKEPPESIVLDPATVFSSPNVIILSRHMPAPTNDTNEPNIVFLTPEQVETFFAVITDIRDKALFCTMYHYGLRVGEAVLLRLQDVDIGGGQIYIRREKGGISGTRPLFRNTKHHLKAYLEVRQPTGSALFTSRQGGLHRSRTQQLFRKYVQAAGLPRRYPVRALRHSTFVHLLAAGLDVEFIQEHLGLQQVQNVIRYTHLVRKEQRPKISTSYEWLLQTLNA